jgi:hypothetical protein
MTETNTGDFSQALNQAHRYCADVEQPEECNGILCERCQ